MISRNEKLDFREFGMSLEIMHLEKWKLEPIN